MEVRMLVFSKILHIQLRVTSNSVENEENMLRINQTQREREKDEE